MHTTPNPRDTYLQIAELVAAHLEESETVLSEAQLMHEHQVSRGTVRRALQHLESQGLVHPESGIGWLPGRRGPTLLEKVAALHEALADGDRFPSEASLCEQFGFSRIAVRRVLALLEGDGRLTVRQGAGRTVRKTEEKR